MPSAFESRAAARGLYALVLVITVYTWWWTLSLYFAQEDFSIMLNASTAPWRELFAVGPLFRPVFLGVWVPLQWQLFGLHPLPWHVLTLCLFLANVTLVWMALRACELQLSACAVATAIYAISMVHFQGVAWVAGSISEMAAFWCLLPSVIALGKQPHRLAPLIYTGCALCGVFTYDTAVVLGLALPVARMVSGRSLSHAIRETAGATLVVACYSLWRLYSASQPPADIGEALYTVQFGWNIPENAGLGLLILLFPAWAAWGLEQGLGWQRSGAVVGALAAAVFVFVMYVALLRSNDRTDRRRSLAVLTLGLVWMIAALLPTLPLASFYPGRLAVSACGLAVAVAALYQMFGPPRIVTALFLFISLAFGLQASVLAGRLDTLQIRDKQLVAKRILSDLEQFRTEHPDVKAVMIPTLEDRFGLGAAATYWGAAVRLAHPDLALLQTDDLVTVDAVELAVREGRLVPIRNIKAE